MLAEISKNDWRAATITSVPRVSRRDGTPDLPASERQVLRRNGFVAGSCDGFLAPATTGTLGRAPP